MDALEHWAIVTIDWINAFLQQFHSWPLFNQLYRPYLYQDLIRLCTLTFVSYVTNALLYWNKFQLQHTKKRSGGLYVLLLSTIGMSSSCQWHVLPDATCWLKIEPILPYCISWTGSGIEHTHTAIRGVPSVVRSQSKLGKLSCVYCIVICRIGWWSANVTELHMVPLAVSPPSPYLYQDLIWRRVCTLTFVCLESM